MKDEINLKQIVSSIFILVLYPIMKLRILKNKCLILNTIIGRNSVRGTILKYDLLLLGIEINLHTQPTNKLLNNKRTCKV